MKRSEMLGKIWDILYKETDLEEEGLRLLSEQILDEIEKYGMKPPGYNQMIDIPDKICLKQVGPIVYEWEDEDNA